jgi:hypothetical protein
VSVLLVPVVLDAQSARPSPAAGVRAAGRALETDSAANPKPKTPFAHRAAAVRELAAAAASGGRRDGSHRRGPPLPGCGTPRGRLLRVARQRRAAGVRRRCPGEALVPRDARLFRARCLQFVPFGMQNRAFCPCLAALDRILNPMHGRHRGCVPMPTFPSFVFCTSLVHTP